MRKLSRVVVAGIVGAVALAGQFTSATPSSAQDARPALTAMRQAAAPTEWQARHDLTSARYQATFDQLTGQGYRLSWVSGYNEGNAARFAAIFERASSPTSQARHGLTSAQYQTVFDQLTGQGYKPILVNGYNVGGQNLYAAIFQQ